MPAWEAGPSGAGQVNGTALDAIQRLAAFPRSVCRCSRSTLHCDCQLRGEGLCGSGCKRRCGVAAPLWQRPRVCRRAPGKGGARLCRGPFTFPGPWCPLPAALQLHAGAARGPRVVAHPTAGTEQGQGKARPVACLCMGMSGHVCECVRVGRHALVLVSDLLHDCVCVCMHRWRTAVWAMRTCEACRVRHKQYEAAQLCTTDHVSYLYCTTRNVTKSNATKSICPAGPGRMRVLARAAYSGVDRGQGAEGWAALFARAFQAARSVA